MKKGIIGGIISLIIGGSTFVVSKTDIIDNFARETGMSQQQAEQYVESAQDGLDSFSNIGSTLVEDGASVLNSASDLDCANYTYEWETYNLDCFKGKSQLQVIGNNEITLGNCYQALGTDLGSAAKAKISECIEDIDTLNASYGLPIATLILDQDTLAEQKNTGIYNKSVLQAAIK